MLRAKASSYGLLAVYEIAREHSGGARAGGVRASDITRKYRLPKAYTAKILSQLANCGVLNSDRGPRGGFRLSRAPEHISLFDILSGVGSLGGETDEKSGPTLPTGLDEVVRKTSDTAQRHIRDVYEKTTVADMLKAG
jgi:Rrf2 family protein